MNESESDDLLDEWCEHWLGSRVAAQLFDRDQASRVFGLRLVDGREVVVKARADDIERVAGCFEVQRRLWEGGYSCPQPLVGPEPFGAGVATAEVLVSGGRMLEPGSDSPTLFAEAPSELVLRAPATDAAPNLDPAPVWARWNHDGDGI